VVAARELEARHHAVARTRAREEDDDGGEVSHLGECSCRVPKTNRKFRRPEPAAPHGEGYARCATAMSETPNGNCARPTASASLPKSCVSRPFTGSFVSARSAPSFSKRDGSSRAKTRAPATAGKSSVLK